ncbi:reprolysin-like metallopeptidase [Emticicia fontis]
MKKILSCLLFLSIQFTVLAQEPVSFGREVQINLNQLTQQLQNANATTDDLLPVVSLPSPGGSSMLFRIKTSPIMENQLSEIKTYSGETLDKNIPIRITITPSGFTAIMRYNNGYYFIEPIEGKSGAYRIYNINEVPKGSCNVNGNETFLKEYKNGRVLSVSPFPIGSQLRTFNMATAATYTMTTGLGGQTQARDKIVSIINAVNLIYEVEVAIRFSLIAETTTSMSIIFNSSAADPFTIDPNFANAGNAQTGFTTLNNNGTLLYSKYHIGHVFNTLPNPGNGSYSGRGQAGPTPCVDNSKARGWTEFTTNAALGMIVSIFAHETGHQFMAWHTYNAYDGPSGFCTSGWDDETAIEPGSGSTLMGYSGNCGSSYVLTAPNNESYFHTKSIEQILNSVNNFNTCYTSSNTGNSPPSANAGNNYTIPKGTPFTLTGSGTDPNGTDVLSYAWEQYDIATGSDKGAFGSNIKGLGNYTAVNSTASAPLFRSKIANVPSRTFPALNFILNNANNPADNEGEDLPQVARTMKFRLTVRDNKANGGGVDSDEATVTVSNTGPFLITSQNSATLWIYNGTNTANITWSKNNTDLAPISCANVKISFSTDGGQTFPIVLAASTPNDGSQIITIPNNLTSTGRIKVEAIGNIFFDINNVNITITNTCSPETSNIIPSTAVSQPAGSANLNLSLTGVGTVINSFSGTIANTDSPTGITVRNQSANCTQFSNATYYDIFTFIPSVSGSYKFSNIGNKLLSIYQTSFNPNSRCTNWVGSSANYDGSFVYTNNDLTVNLTAFTTYKMVITGFSGVPNPASYTINLTSKPASADLFDPVIGSPYAYTYLIYDINSGTIINFEDDPNLSIEATYPAGSYRIYGLSYQGGLSLDSYKGTSFSSFQTLLNNNTVCGKLSDNFINVTITGNTPCSNNVVLVNPTDNITSGNVTKQASATNGKITATNYVTGSGTKATYQAKAVELNAGFKADSGTIFRAETGGCN